jgi:hypothetical protein
MSRSISCPTATPSIVQIVEGVLDNKPVDPVFKVSNYTIRLKELTMEKGKIILLPVPVPKPAATSN